MQQEYHSHFYIIINGSSLRINLTHGFHNEDNFFKKRQVHVTNGSVFKDHPRCLKKVKITIVHTVYVFPEFNYFHNI